jgi:predicted Zn-dependent protease
MVRRIGNDLLDTADLRNTPWKFSFDVIDSKQVNAFALPGGPTFIYSGLLDKLETEDELAGIMGHEMTHVLKEHWAQQYASTQKRQLGIGLLLGILRANRVWQNVGSIVDLMESTKYSRKEESQADDGGFDMMTRVGYNPAGLADVFRMFQRQKNSGASIPFLASHPSDSARIAHIENRVHAMNTNFPPQRPLRYVDRAYNSTTDRGWRSGGGR